MMDIYDEISGLREKVLGVVVSVERQQLLLQYIGPVHFFTRLCYNWY